MYMIIFYYVNNTISFQARSKTLTYRFVYVQSTQIIFSIKFFPKVFLGLTALFCYYYTNHKLETMISLSFARLLWLVAEVVIADGWPLLRDNRWEHCSLVVTPDYGQTHIHTHKDRSRLQVTKILPPTLFLFIILISTICYVVDFISTANIT